MTTREKGLWTAVIILTVSVAALGGFIMLRGLIKNNRFDSKFAARLHSLKLPLWKRYALHFSINRVSGFWFEGSAMLKIRAGGAVFFRGRIDNGFEDCYDYR
ncbi:hypothetical protein [Paenibacillus sp. NPDC055715]